MIIRIIIVIRMYGTYIHTYVRTYIRTYIHTYIHTYMNMCIYIYIYIYMYMYTYRLSGAGRAFGMHLLPGGAARKRYDILCYDTI